MSLLAGLIKPDAGFIKLNGKMMEGPGPDRELSSELLAAAVADGLREYRAGIGPGLPSMGQRATPRTLKSNRDEIGLGARPGPAELSGGMRQRVSVARAFARARHPSAG
jgi:ABC-type taurine transport system ATPase subunit